jgi:seryl-tRNA(Sec) selenium transferase
VFTSRRAGERDLWIVDADEGEPRRLTRDARGYFYASYAHDGQWVVVADTVSGGKALKGPQATGILVGKRGPIEAARLNASPNTNIGRGMKVGKEEVVALVVARENHMKRDHQNDLEEWERRARWLAARLQGIRGLVAEAAINTKGYYDVAMSWDEALIPFTHAQIRER